MDLSSLAVVSSTALILNLGAGRLRAVSPKFSFRWFLYIHLPVLAIFPLRQWFGLGPWAIPLLIAVSFAGQVIGGRIHHNTR
ncbi:MAG: hypothetical protein HY207_12250 [Nitrospirae bacterium]|nr:hypothetical protein [Nitrospirota bacterium]